MEFAFNPHDTLLGTAFTPAGEERIALSERDRMQHCLLLGKTGRGKTTTLFNIVVQDIYAGRGVSVIDPHGDLSRDLLDNFPSFRARDLVLIDPADEERIVTFNPVAAVPRNQIATATASVVAAFKGVYGDSWGYRMERILYNAVAALIEAPKTSLIGLPKLLKSSEYRHHVLLHVRDPMVLDFFTTEYEVWRDDYRATVVEPVLNKVEQLFAAPFLRAMFGSVTSSIDFTDIMDGKKVLIANLAKGTLGGMHTHLLGAMLVSAYSTAAMARASQEPGKRVTHYLSVDEFQNFATAAFAEILSELRKQGLSLTLSHQYLDQAPPALRAAVLGNVGSIIAFELGAQDADAIASELGLKSGAALTEQGQGEAWMKHATYGGPHHPRLLAPIVTRATGRASALKEHRLRNTFPRARVDQKIMRFYDAWAARDDVGR